MLAAILIEIACCLDSVSYVGYRFYSAITVEKAKETRNINNSVLYNIHPYK
uniref:Uncharacterized protein n=1 Tax=Anguilla anguilla TaxID=7936 RepID=A0A0E9U1R3_ANGAN